ncbi:MAG: tRNA (adenosine(37)-N6)-threonylcarbamoyltransferase complex ATPase subunit type 1 TsaE [Flavobacteriales bacterium]|nr:tRNA (adenosine(37)-N6)-threonylcarbamoyltransferase complex ATPase subunit type 1 TsaE [Flavobacteriales bacterium]
MKFVVNCISDLKEVAVEVLRLSGGKNIICFYGEMGVGKTTFIKEICKELEVIDNVSSPTFSIVNEYKTKNDKSVFHFDFYRLETEEEAFDMGYEEYFYNDNLCFVEWPEKIKSLLPNEILKVEMIKENEKRIIEIL